MNEKRKGNESSDAANSTQSDAASRHEALQNAVSSCSSAGEASMQPVLAKRKTQVPKEYRNAEP